MAAAGTRRRSRSESPLGMGIPTLLKSVWATHKEMNNKWDPEIQAEFKRVPEYIGTVCDPIGFRQHSGECATDTLQQILLFADDWKAKTQPLVYTMTPEIFAHQLHQGFELPSFVITLLEDFMKNLQMRFRLHYNLIGTTKHALNESTCIQPFAYRKFLKELLKGEEEGLTEAMILRKRRLSANLGKGASMAIKEMKRAEYRTSDWFNIVWNFCGLQQYEMLFRERHTLPSKYHDIRPGYNHVAFYLASNVIDTRAPLAYWNNAVDREYNGHATGIYSCNDKWVYYDDNRGIMELHPKLMDDLINEVDQFYIFWAYYQKNAILFYKVDVKTRDKWALSHWYKNKWRKLPLETLEDYRIGEDETRATRTKPTLHSVNRILHITTKDWSSPGFNGRHFIDDHTEEDLGWTVAENSPSPVIGSVPPTPPSSPHVDPVIRRVSPSGPTVRRTKSAHSASPLKATKRRARRASHG